MQFALKCSKGPTLLSEIIQAHTEHINAHPDQYQTACSKSFDDRHN